MRRLLLKLVVLFLPFISLGQTHFEEQSTAFVSHNELKGNVILHHSEKIREAKNVGMHFQSFTVQPLQAEFSDEVKSLEIERIELKDNHCLIQFNAAGFCGYSYLGEIQIIGNTLNLIYQGYGSSTLGNCRYTFQYEVKKELNEAMLNLKYIMINGNPETKKELGKKFVN
ncbi:hypothetical protein [Flavobacterium sp.]|jgi:hypothetical protein|uniref:hypothetical protein n=1 Tax=Flavobacterium sp. TaxID=239 RepID=UPI0037BE9B0F